MSNNLLGPQSSVIAVSHLKHGIRMIVIMTDDVLALIKKRDGTLNHTIDVDFDGQRVIVQLLYAPTFEEAEVAKATIIKQMAISDLNIPSHGIPPVDTKH